LRPSAVIDDAKEPQQWVANQPTVVLKR